MMNTEFKYPPGAQKVDAVYSTDIGTYENNPLIAALQPSWSTEQIASALSWWPEYDPSCHAKDPDQRREWAEDLEDGFETMPKHVEILTGILNKMRRTYQGRDRFVHGYTEQIRANAVELMGSQHGGVRMASTSNSLLVHGLPGTGKTSLALRIGTLVPQIIDHTEFKGRPFPCRQITYLYIAAQQNWTDKALAQAILREFDRVAGTDYSGPLRKGNASAFSYLMQFSIAANNHGLGALIIDEVQSLRDNASLLDFAFNFSNTNKVLLVMVGTPESVQVLGQTPRFMRRADAMFDTELKRYAFPQMDKASYNGMLQDENRARDPWTWFLESFCHRQFTAKSKPFDYDISLTLFTKSVGIPHYAVKIFAGAQQRRIGTDRDYLDCDALTEAYLACSKTSLEYLDLLREGKFIDLRKYADFAGVDLGKIAATNAANAKSGKKPQNHSEGESPPPAPVPTKPKPPTKDGPKVKPDPVGVDELPRAAGNDFL